MKLHENSQLYNQAIRTTAQYKNLPEIYVEKDYWITLALHRIFSTETGLYTVFKGGTSLSKCHHVIQRFSEDIDLGVVRNPGDTENKLKTKLKKISETVTSVIPETIVEGITHKKGMIRKTAHSYKKSFDGSFGQIRDILIIEATWLGGTEPYSKATICSYITEMMLSNQQHTLISEYMLSPFEVSALSLNRTLCEKIMSLLRFSFSPNPIENLNSKIRHIYDIHKMLQVKDVSIFFSSETFDKLLLEVATKDLISFKNNNGWLLNHPSEAILFRDVSSVWKQLQNTYSTTFRDLVYEKLPDENAVVETLIKLRDRLRSTQWDISKNTTLN